MDIERQLAHLRRGPAPRPVVRPCTVGDGISRLDAAAIANARRAAADAATRGDVCMFVPASGAATRLVRGLAPDAGTTRAELADVPRRIFDALPGLAPWADLVAAGAAEGVDVAARHAAGDVVAVLGLLARALGGRPKALVPFHPPARSPLEEHLRTAALLTADADGAASIHFTVSADHREAFQEASARLCAAIAEEQGVRLRVTFSVQDPATDTVCVRADGELVRDDHGTPVRRPGGHGALLANLRHADRPLVLVSNVDNVIATSHVAPLSAGRATLIGVAAAISARIDHAVARRDVAAARALCAELSLPVADPFAALHRPLRVCGMVPSSGKPGGGPFWVREAGGARPQIVESVELPADMPLHSATHFNPVEMVLAPRGHDPAGHADLDAVLITTKAVRGADATVLEHPGLWNGGMAGWATLFVELPPETCKPVKTLADLLDPAHGA